MISVMFITYVVFNNPIEITNGLFAFVLIICFAGWLGLLSGLYFFELKYNINLFIIILNVNFNSNLPYCY